MTLEELKIVTDNMDAEKSLPVNIRVDFGDEKKSFTIARVMKNGLAGRFAHGW